MSSTEVENEATSATPAAATGDLKLEVVVIPVADVDRAKEFYAGLGWRLDADFAVRQRLPGRPVHAAGLARARSSSARTSPRPRPARPRACT